MEIQIKKAIKAGNSSAVILPRSWLNKQVRVELLKKTRTEILSDVLEILNKKINLASIIGIYLVGSYARGEEKEESDIDVLVITKESDKEIINEGIYNILIVSDKLIYQKLDQDLLPIGQMIKEAVPLINSDCLKNLNIKVTEKNVKWYLNTCEEKLKIIQKYLNNAKNQNKKALNDRIAYTLVLRIRTLKIIENLIKNKIYSKKSFEKLIKITLNAKSAYEGYLTIKNNLKEEDKCAIDETERLYNYLKKDLIKVRKMLKSH